MSDDKYAVIATNIETGKRRVMKAELTEANAEAFVHMAVMRRGVDHEIFHFELENLP